MLLQSSRLWSKELFSNQASCAESDTQLLLERYHTREDDPYLVGCRQQKGREAMLGL